MLLNSYINDHKRMSTQVTRTGEIITVTDVRSSKIIQTSKSHMATIFTKGWVVSPAALPAVDNTYKSVTSDILDKFSRCNYDSVADVHIKSGLADSRRLASGNFGEIKSIVMDHIDELVKFSTVDMHNADAVALVFTFACECWATFAEYASPSEQQYSRR